MFFFFNFTANKSQADDSIQETLRRVGKIISNANEINVEGSIKDKAENTTEVVMDAQVSVFLKVLCVFVFCGHGFISSTQIFVCCHYSFLVFSNPKLCHSASWLSAGFCENWVCRRNFVRTLENKIF